MSNKPPRPPLVPQGKHPPTGDSKVQRAPKPEAALKAGPDKSAPHRTRRRSGAMRATTRPDNPLAVFKAKEAPTPATSVPVPPVPPNPLVPPPVPRAQRRVSPPPRIPQQPPMSPPPAPRVPAPPAAASVSLPVLAPPPLPAPARAATANAVTEAPPAPSPAAPAERLDITVSAVPHPRLPELEPPPQDLPEPVTTTPSQLPAAPRKRVAIAAGAAAVLVACVAGSWLVPRLYGSQPLAAKAALLAAPAAKSTQATAAAAAAPPPAAPATLPTSSGARSAVPTAAAPSPSADSGLPWLDGTVTTDCTPPSNTDGVPSLQDQAKAQQEYAKGRRLLVQGKLPDSLRAFCAAARLNPLHSGLAFEVARAALIARDAVTASRFAEHSLALTPPDRRSRELLADALAWQGNVEAARAAWLQIHKLSAPTEKTLANLALGAVLEARAVAKQGDYATAERYLRRALAFGPEDVATTTQLARVLLLAGHPEPAARWIQRALALDAADPERHVLAGEIHDKLGDRSAANRHYSRALELDPNHALAKLRMRAQTP